MHPVLLKTSIFYELSKNLDIIIIIYLLYLTIIIIEINTTIKLYVQLRITNKLTFLRFLFYKFIL